MKGHPDDHLADAYDGFGALDTVRWMIEQEGWAVEPVPARPDTSPPSPGYTYTLGLPALTSFADVVVCGLTPVAARGLLGLIVDALRGGTEIPLGVELVGLLDNELRCMFGVVDVEQFDGWFETGCAWYETAAFPLVQLLYPDRNGFMPYEAGFDQRMRFAQPVLAALSSE